MDAGVVMEPIYRRSPFGVKVQLEADAHLPIGWNKGKQRGMKEPAKKRLKALIDAKGWDMKRASTEAGLNPAYVQQLLSRRTGGSGEGLAKLANALGTTVDYLLTGSLAGGTNRALPSVNPVQKVPVLGKTAAGMWMEVEELPTVVAAITALETEYEGDQFAYLVQGPSMNLRKIHDGSYVICVSPWQSSGLKTGDIVVVERRRGQATERTVKELAIVGKTYELWPRSDVELPVYQRPIVVDPDHWTEDDGTIVEIVGRVLSVQTFL